jgi:hypothetical protein
VLLENRLQVVEVGIVKDAFLDDPSVLSSLLYSLSLTPNSQPLRTDTTLLRPVISKLLAQNLRDKVASAFSASLRA